jgi:hypothetical protein
MHLLLWPLLPEVDSDREPRSEDTAHNCPRFVRRADDHQICAAEDLGARLCSLNQIQEQLAVFLFILVPVDRVRAIRASIMARSQHLALPSLQCYMPSSTSLGQFRLYLPEAMALVTIEGEVACSDQLLLSINEQLAPVHFLPRLKQFVSESQSLALSTENNPTQNASFFLNVPDHLPNLPIQDDSRPV